MHTFTATVIATTILYIKVSPIQYDGWNDPEFDDSQWISAYEVDNNVSPQTRGWTVRKKISRDAMWIGGNSTGIPYIKPTSTHYFRRSLGKT